MMQRTLAVIVAVVLTAAALFFAGWFAQKDLTLYAMLCGMFGGAGMMALGFAVWLVSE